MNDKYDLIIVGGGPAGLTAAIYSSRAGLNALIIEKAQIGGQLWLTESIENYPGFRDGIKSIELAAQMEAQAKKFGTCIINDEVLSISEAEGDFILLAKSGNNFIATSIIITVGAVMKQLGVEGEVKFAGKGVSYCGICDGPLFREKEIIVVGGGNTACEEAAFLTRFAKKVFLVHRRPELRAVDYLKNKVKNNSKITILLEKELKSINGDEIVRSVTFKDNQILDIGGVFIFVGYKPATGFLEKVLALEAGFIKAGKELMSSINGVFVAGDCRLGAFKQVITASGEGASAAENARKYIERKKGTSYDW